MELPPGYESPFSSLPVFSSPSSNFQYYSSACTYNTHENDEGVPSSTNLCLQCFLAASTPLLCQPCVLSLIVFLMWIRQSINYRRCIHTRTLSILTTSLLQLLRGGLPRWDWYYVFSAFVR